MSTDGIIGTNIDLSEKSRFHKKSIEENTDKYSPPFMFDDRFQVNALHHEDTYKCKMYLQYEQDSFEALEKELTIDYQSELGSMGIPIDPDELDKDVDSYLLKRNKSIDRYVDSVLLGDYQDRIPHHICSTKYKCSVCGKECFSFPWEISPYFVIWLCEEHKQESASDTLIHRFPFEYEEEDPFKSKVGLLKIIPESFIEVYEDLSEAGIRNTINQLLDVALTQGSLLDRDI